QELIAFAVAFEFEVDVLSQRLERREKVDLHGMVDHEVAGHQRLNLLGIAPHANHGTAQGGQIDDGGNAGKILQDDASRHERNFDLLGRFSVPVGQIADVAFVDDEIVEFAETGFEQHADRK